MFEFLFARRSNDIAAEAQYHREQDHYLRAIIAYTRVIRMVDQSSDVTRNNMRHMRGVTLASVPLKLRPVQWLARRDLETALSFAERRRIPRTAARILRDSSKVAPSLEQAISLCERSAGMYRDFEAVIEVAMSEAFIGRYRLMQADQAQGEARGELLNEALDYLCQADQVFTEHLHDKYAMYNLPYLFKAYMGVGYYDLARQVSSRYEFMAREHGSFGRRLQSILMHWQSDSGGHKRRQRFSSAH